MVTGLKRMVKIADNGESITLSTTSSLRSLYTELRATKVTGLHWVSVEDDEVCELLVANSITTFFPRRASVMPLSERGGRCRLRWWDVVVAVEVVEREDEVDIGVEVEVAADVEWEDLEKSLDNGDFGCAKDFGLRVWKPKHPMLSTATTTKIKDLMIEAPFDFQGSCTSLFLCQNL